MKKELRSRVLRERQGMDRVQIIEKSRAIKSRLFSLPEFKNSNKIMLYVSYKNEVDTIDMIEEGIKMGKEIIVPIVVPGERELLLSRLMSLDELASGSYGILEPKKECIRPVDSKQIDMVVAPGVAFDEKGFRLGYGGGYYDRLLRKLNDKCSVIAIAFENQIVPEVPSEPHDMKVDMIITEDRVINP